MIRFCLKCGKDIGHLHGLKKYCGVFCKSGPTNLFPSKTCGGCGKEFKASHGNLLYCGPSCRPDYATSILYHRVLDVDIIHGKFKKPQERVCRSCGRKFKARYVRTIYCNFDCREDYYRSGKFDRVQGERA